MIDTNEKESQKVSSFWNKVFQQQQEEEGKDKSLQYNRTESKKNFDVENVINIGDEKEEEFREKEYTSESDLAVPSFSVRPHKQFWRQVSWGEFFSSLSSAERMLSPLDLARTE